MAMSNGTLHENLTAADLLEMKTRLDNDLKHLLDAQSAFNQESHGGELQEVFESPYKQQPACTCHNRSTYETGEKGLVVKAVVADGLKANMKAASTLGFDLNATNPKCYINHPHTFHGSKPTCEFIRIIVEYFDHLNAKNPLAKGHKAALSRDNQDKWQEFFKQAKAYPLTLLDHDDTPLRASQRGQAIVGFIVTGLSTKELVKEVLESGRLKCLLLYKFSQDHLRMFFSKIRRRGGWNYNLSAEQFRHSLRILLHQNEVKAPSSGNTIQLDETSLRTHLGIENLPLWMLNLFCKWRT
ncbi:THAP domain-containing protein [Plakobranchus ocellatus]|uniref:THAP domain-containing protein n=1 Tax=Plakobranchus ocellatus TaxID=259542 RepID=A0AAV3Y0H8_9GAST|nr:THAP domain-containing protein [Plakobranchus ocellatus]